MIPIVAQVCLHALECVPTISTFCCIYATSVLLQPETIIAGYKLLEREPLADFVMGVSEYSQPPVQALKTDDQGYLSYMWPEWSSVQSQSQPKLVVSNGSFYWARKEAVVEETFYGKRLRGLMIPSDQVSDIDTIDDLNSVTDKIRENKNDANELYKKYSDNYMGTGSNRKLDNYHRYRIDSFIDLLGRHFDNITELIDYIVGWRTKKSCLIDLKNTLG